MFHRQPSDAERPGTVNGTPNYVMPNNTAALAASDGTIWSAGWTNMGGEIVIDHGPRKVATYYAHLERLDVKKGDRVSAGDAIGVVGAPPNTADALKHLHFEVWLGGPDDRIDPEPLMQAWQVVNDPRGGLWKVALAVFLGWGVWTLVKTQRGGGIL